MSLIESIDKEILTKIKNCSELRSFQAGEVLYSEGELPINVYLIEEGLVGLTTLSAQGQETLLRVFGKNYFFGHRSLIAQEKRHASAVVLKKSKIRVLCFHSLDEMQERFPQLLPLLAKVLAKELKYSELRLADLTSKKVSARIIESLIFLKNRYPDYKWTRREIGEFSGAQTETVTRTLSKLEKEGLIKKVGREIIIPNENNLIRKSETYFI